MTPTPTPDPGPASDGGAKDVEAEFRRLAAELRAATKYSSRLIDRFEHPAHRAIVALGEPVVPVLLREMRDSPSWWNYTLTEITGANPDPEPEQKGVGWVALSLARIATAWVAWGREHGYDV